MFRHRSAASAALLVSALALLTAAASADSVKYTEVAYGQLVPSEYPLDEVFFTDVDEEDIEGDGVVEEAAVDGGAEAADEGGEVTAQASCRSIRKPSGRGRRPSGGGSSRKYAENFMREAKRYRNKVCGSDGTPSTSRMSAKSNNHYHFAELFVDIRVRL